MRISLHIELHIGDDTDEQPTAELDASVEPGDDPASPQMHLGFRGGDQP